MVRCSHGRTLPKLTKACESITLEVRQRGMSGFHRGLHRSRILRGANSAGKISRYSSIVYLTRGGRLLAQSRETLAVACTPIQGSWFEFPVQSNQAFHPSRVGELIYGKGIYPRRGKHRCECEKDRSIVTFFGLEITKKGQTWASRRGLFHCLGFEKRFILNFSLLSE